MSLLKSVSGVLCLIIGAAILVMDACLPENVAAFFGVDVLQDYEEFYPGLPFSYV